MKKYMIVLTVFLVCATFLIPNMFAETMKDKTPPVITIENPVEGYFHFSGIKLFETPFDVVGDTMGLGGFRVRPVQATITDDVDTAEQISAAVYIKDVVTPGVYQKERDMTYNSRNGLFEGKWIGPGLGTFYMKIEAEDSSGNTAKEVMTVWYFCFVPES